MSKYGIKVSGNNFFCLVRCTIKRSSKTERHPRYLFIPLSQRR